MSLSDPKAFRCLIVEDDPDFAGLVASVVQRAGGDVTLAATVAAARGAVSRGPFELVLLDNRLPDGTGYEFHEHLVTAAAGALVIMVTGVPELAQAVALTRNGLFDYLPKPVEIGALEAAIARARLRWSHSEVTTGEPGFVGTAPAFQLVAGKLQQAARHREAIVLLLGETGTGKELAARQLHRWGHPNEDAPFVALNCSAVPAEMFEAELFGSERGAYTGADRRRGGLVEAADVGTLFLDEIGDVPLTQQSKLLRFLESREYRALGASVTRRFGGRIVAATNRDLPEEVRRGRFRQDLLYRLDVVRVLLPPLRERREDIPVLTRHLLEQLCRKYGRRCPTLRPGDIEDLQRHAFPGNVRELRNILERSLLHTVEGDPCLALDRSWLSSAPSGGWGGLAGVDSRGTTSGLAPPVAGGADSGRQLTPMELQEYELFKRVLGEEGGAIRRTAARLGVSHQVVLRRLRWWPELRDLTRRPGSVEIGEAGEPQAG